MISSVFLLFRKGLFVRFFCFFIVGTHFTDYLAFEGDLPFKPSEAPADAVVALGTDAFFLAVTAALALDAAVVVFFIDFLVSLPPMVSWLHRWFLVFRHVSFGCTVVETLLCCASATRSLISAPVQLNC